MFKGRKFWILYICFLAMTALFLLFPPDYIFIYDWVSGRWKDRLYVSRNTEKNSTPILFLYSPFLYKNQREYYRAISLSEYDIEAAKQLLYSLLAKELDKDLRRRVVHSLAELHFISKEYADAAEYYWELLQLYPKNKNYKNNYEVLVRLSEVKRSRIADSELRFSSDIEENSEEDAPIYLTPIQKSSTFLLHLNDEEEDPTLPQW